MNGRNGLSWFFALACSAAAGWVSLQAPRVGRCGSAMYFGFRLLAALVLNGSGVRSIHAQSIGLGLVVFLSAVTFLIPAAVWLRRVQGRWREGGLLVWTAIYLGAYFFLLPVPDCP